MFLASVGGLLSGGFCVLGGRAEERGMSVSCSCRFGVVRFMCSWSCISLFFCHDVTRIHVSGRCRGGRGLGVVLVVGEFEWGLPPTHNFASELVWFTTRGRFH